MPSESAAQKRERIQRELADLESAGASPDQIRAVIGDVKPAPEEAPKGSRLADPHALARNRWAK